MPDLHPEDIKAAIRKKGMSLAELARLRGVPGQQLRHALVFPRERAEAVIAEFLGKNPATIWPSRYNRDGSRKRPQPVENYRPEPRFGNPS